MQRTNEWNNVVRAKDSFNAYVRMWKRKGWSKQAVDLN